jgi:hypothetical protein
MTASARLAAFGLAAAIALGGGAALGAAAGPAPAPAATVHSDHEDNPMPSTALAPTHASNSASGENYRIHVASTVVTAGEPQPLSFVVLDGAGEPVTQFEDRHERPMHLIVVSNDLADYAHLHPKLGAGGTWSAELPALDPGGYRVVADAVPAGGPDLVLTVDLVVPGVAAGRPLPEPTRIAVVDDLEVGLDLAPAADGLVAGLTVRRAGLVVEPEPYLGARGHLVAIDADDLAYLHVHPTDSDGPVSFAIADPTPGRYRLFFDFSVDGQVRTAAFTVDISADTAGATGEGHAHAEGEGHR